MRLKHRPDPQLSAARSRCPAPISFGCRCPRHHPLSATWFSSHIPDGKAHPKRGALTLAFHLDTAACASRSLGTETCQPSPSQPSTRAPCRCINIGTTLTTPSVGGWQSWTPKLAHLRAWQPRCGDDHTNDHAPQKVILSF